MTDNGDMYGSAQPPRRLRSTSPAVMGWVGTGAVVVVVLVLLLINAATRTGSTGPVNRGSTAPTSLVDQVTNVPASVLDEVGIAGNTISSNPADNAANPISRPNKTGNGLPDVDGKPVVFYFGALWCPYCATERWAMIVALSRFGTFTGLQAAASSASDVYPNTQTWSFDKATYTSHYIVFQPDEFQDMNRNNLTQPTAAQLTVLNSWDPEGAFPFLTIGTRYVAAIPAWMDPQLLQGLSREQIATALSEPNSRLGSSILANANYLTAAICSTDGMQPGSVCSSQGVQAALAQLQRAPAAVPFGS